MAESLTRVACERVECVNYRKDGDAGPMILCAHPEKPAYLRAVPCPLFKLGLGRAPGGGNPRDFLKMIRKF